MIKHRLDFLNCTCDNCRGSLTDLSTGRLLRELNIHKCRFNPEERYEEAMRDGTKFVVMVCQVKGCEEEDRREQI